MGNSQQTQVFLLKFSCFDRTGLLHDATQVLCELELMIRSVKVSTTPDGRVADLFFITDNRELLHTKSRKDEECNQLRTVLGDCVTSCEIDLASEDMSACLQASSSLLLPISEQMFSLELHQEEATNRQSCPTSDNSLSVTMDNSLSPVHTLIQIQCGDHKVILYDIMRTLKNYNIQPKWALRHRLKKIVDSHKQKALCSRLRMELFQPLRVTLINRGSDTELLVVNPVELSGKGWPLIFYDITYALKLLDTRIFLAEIGRHVVGGREWEVYRVRLGDNHELSTSSNKIVDGVTKMLMGWN